MVAPDSSMSMIEEIEFDDADMVCSTSPEPEMCYGKLNRIVKIFFITINLQRNCIIPKRLKNIRGS